MLSAFQAQAILELKQRDKSKIESLLAYGDRLLVGLNTGALRTYRVIDSQPEGDTDVVTSASETDGDAKPGSISRKVECLHEEEKFSKRPIQQLAIVKEANLMVSLSDGYISLHDLRTYALVERLEKTRGATCFAAMSNVVKDTETNIPSLVSRLAVGVKRKVLVWTWQDMELTGDVKELNLEAAVKSLTWAEGNRIVAGMDPGFSVVDVETDEVVPVNKIGIRANARDERESELAGVRFAAVSSSGMGYMGMGSWVPKPMATRLSQDELLLAKDVNTLFVDSRGKGLEKRQVPWSLAPEAIGYSYPYLLALQPPERGALQVRNPDTLSLLQTINVPQAAILHVPQPNISLAHAGKGFIVASDRVVWRMNALPYPAQLQDLVDKHRFDEAISLLNLLEDTLIDDKAGRIRDVMSYKATALFHQKKYRPALDLFTDAQAPPETVIALYPKSIAGDLSEAQGSPEQSEEEPVEDTTDSDTKPDDTPAKEAASTPSKSVFNRFMGSTKKAEPDAASVRSFTKNDPDIAGTPSTKATLSKSAMHPTQPLAGEDLKLAVRALCSFLAQTRVQIQKYLSTDGVLKDHPPVLDPETHKTAFANLLPPSTFEKKAEDMNWQSELLAVAKFVDTTLFRSYMLALPSLAGPLFRLDNFCDPDVVQTSLYESGRYGDLIDFLHGKKLHRQALEMLAKFGRGEADGEVPEGMHGPGRMVTYLKTLPPELLDTVLEFARWPIQEQPDLGMDVFLADTDFAERMDRERVRGFLVEIDARLEQKYLEHIIDEFDDETPAFHQRLIELLIEELDAGELPEEKKQSEEAKLETFLRKSGVYNKMVTLNKLPKDSPLFYESRAIVLSAMGQHKQALSIYVFQIKDPEKAEDYCNRIYLAEQNAREAEECLLESGHVHEKAQFTSRYEDEGHEKGSNVFAMLLSLYLRPPPGEESRWPQALDLLSKHGSRLPATNTLDLMPNDLAVKEMKDYFRGRIRAATSLLREERVVRSLEEVRKARTEYALQLGQEPEQKLGGRNKRAIIKEDDHCRVCHKRFGASAIRVRPDGVVVHYGCIGRAIGERKKSGAGIGGRASVAWA